MVKINSNEIYRLQEALSAKHVLLLDICYLMYNNRKINFIIKLCKSQKVIETVWLPQASNTHDIVTQYVIQSVINKGG